MDFNKFISLSLVTVLIFLQRFIGLIITPYKTMRKISQDTDKAQVICIFILVYIYFFLMQRLKEYAYPSYVIFVIFFLNFLVTVLFFRGMSRLLHGNAHVMKIVPTLAYGLIPTLIWFISNSILFVILPPPHSYTMYGKLFSIFFLSFSISLLIWKIMLFYLAVRFSTGMKFITICYIVLLYLCIFLPATFFMYQLQVFRVPFI